MNLRLYIICIAVVLALAGSAAAANSTAIVHGTVYDCNTFKPLDNAVVEVNSTPSQSMVAKYGLYSFDLAPGDYNITAIYYQNNSATYSATEIIKIKDQGKYVRDILLLPVYSKELMDNSEDQNKNAESSSSNTTTAISQATSYVKGNSSNTNLAGQIGVGSINVNHLLIVALLLLLLLAGGYRLSRRNKKIEEQSQKGISITRKGHMAHMTRSPSKSEGSKFSEEVHDKRLEAPHIESEIKTAQVQDQVELSETAVIEPVPVEEPPVIEPVKESLKKPLKESTLETLEETGQAGEPTEIKNVSPVTGKEMVESELQKEKQEVVLEEAADKPIESSKTEILASRKKLPLPSDLQEVMDIIRGQGGRITQKDLRSKLKYSEGKVSLMLADLERRELIEKFKRGRGNIVILKDEER